MIKNPFNFFVGVFCVMCFIVGITLHRDEFTLGISAFLAVVNLAIGLMG